VYYKKWRDKKQRRELFLTRCALRERKVMDADENFAVSLSLALPSAIIEVFA
jgi:hypothetical protein